MKRVRSTPYAVLGLLSLRPMSGYDIRKASEESVGHFWSESYGQIYPALRELTERGLARRRSMRRPGRPDRHVYEITEPGRKELRRWLTEPPRRTPLRSELLLKLFFGDPTTTTTQIAWLEAMEKEAAAQLEAYAGIARELGRESADDPHVAHWRVTLSFGVHRAEANRRWARKAITALRSVGEPSSKARRAPAKRKPS
jgi:DNA-binding PadR family transcriptional regulator